MILLKKTCFTVWKRACFPKRSMAAGRIIGQPNPAGQSLYYDGLGRAKRARWTDTSGSPAPTNNFAGDAATLLQDVMLNSGRDLEPVYGDVFKIENKNINKETIWEIQFSAQIPTAPQWSKRVWSPPGGL